MLLWVVATDFVKIASKNGILLVSLSLLNIPSLSPFLLGKVVMVHALFVELERRKMIYGY